MQHFSADTTIFSKKKIFLFFANENIKNGPQKLLIIAPNQSRIYFLYYKYVQESSVSLSVIGYYLANSHAHFFLTSRNSKTGRYIISLHLNKHQTINQSRHFVDYVQKNAILHRIFYSYIHNPTSYQIHCTTKQYCN